MVPREPRVIDRVLPAVASLTSRMPIGMRRAYGDLSNRVLDSSSVYRGMRSSIAEMGSALIDFSDSPETPDEERIHAFARAVRPWTAPNLELSRVGGAGDGAYAMAPFDDAGGAISLGVGHDVSWDVAVAAAGVRVAMFDPTVDGLPQPVPGGTFHRIGIGGQPIRGLDLRPLHELVALAGYTGTDNIILKIDVEGAEWEALRYVDFSPFQQVLIEMHDLHRLQDAESAAAVLDVAGGLAVPHRCVHVHANNERPFHRFGRIWFPEVIEATFVRRDRLDNAIPATGLDHSLDRPTNPGYPDYDLAGVLTVAI